MTSVVQVLPGTAVLWTARDMMAGESFQIMFSSEPPSDKCAQFVPLVIDGGAVKLTHDRPMEITAIPGYYKAVPDAPPVKATVVASEPFSVTLTRNI